MQGAITKALLGGRLMFPTEYVAAVEFRGKDVTLTIASVKLEDLQIKGAKKERKPILTFVETKKKLVLNKTNAGSIADMYGVAAEAWVGKKITLYPTRTQCGRDTVDCIRVRHHRPKADAPVPQFDEPEPREEEDDFQRLADRPDEKKEDARDLPAEQTDQAASDAAQNPVDQSIPADDSQIGDAEKLKILAKELFASGDWQNGLLRFAKEKTPRGASMKWPFLASAIEKFCGGKSFTADRFAEFYAAVAGGRLNALDGTISQ